MEIISKRSNTISNKLSSEKKNRIKLGNVEKEIVK